MNCPGLADLIIIMMMRVIGTHNMEGQVCFIQCLKYLISGIKGVTTYLLLLLTSQGWNMTMWMIHGVLVAILRFKKLPRVESTIYLLGKLEWHLQIQFILLSSGNT